MCHGEQNGTSPKAFRPAPAVPAAQGVLPHLPRPRPGQRVRPREERGSLGRGRPAGSLLHSANAPGAHVPPRPPARGARRTRREVPFLPFLYVSYAAGNSGGKTTASSRAGMTPRRRRGRDRRGHSARQRATGRGTRGGRLLARPGADGPRPASFPSPITQQLCLRHLRPNRAGGGVCALAVSRSGPSRSPGRRAGRCNRRRRSAAGLQPAAGPSARPPPRAPAARQRPLPGAHPEEADGSSARCGEGPAEVRATPGSPPPAALGRRWVGNR